MILIRRPQADAAPWLDKLGARISEYYGQFLNYKAVNSPRHDIGPSTSWPDDD